MNSTYTSRTGYWYRLGRLVFVYGTFVVSTSGTNTNGAGSAMVVSVVLPVVASNVLGAADPPNGMTGRITYNGGIGPTAVQPYSGYDIVVTPLSGLASATVRLIRLQTKVGDPVGNTQFLSSMINSLMSFSYRGWYLA
jgi:hypothetical protein